jgi:hypothetical protein
MGKPTMNDFDDVLERLVSDPSFQAALARDPDAALAGYHLADEERELLRAQVVTGAGGDRLVEARTTKSGMAGLLGPVVAALGVASGGPSAGGTQSLGAAGGGTESFGQGPKASESFGSASDTGGDEGFGTAAGGSDSMGSAPAGVKGGADSMGEAPSLVEAADYRTSVDVDGDGSWDRNRAYERADGGVDIHVDINSDGVADFVGHDYDRDGLVDDAEFDDDLDGTMDRRMHDDTGDGWMDRETPIPRGTQQSFGQAPAS